MCGTTNLLKPEKIRVVDRIGDTSVVESSRLIAFESDQFKV